ncbi:MAG: TRASH domain-containing protein, partial [Halobacteriaceae archaeon]
DLLDGADYTVTLVDDYEWTPSVDGTEFALNCAECGNTVDSEGETTRIDGDVYHFCCPSCASRFQERYTRHAEQA